MAEARSTFWAVIRGDTGQAVTEFKKLGREVQSTTGTVSKDLVKMESASSKAMGRMSSSIAGAFSAGAVVFGAKKMIDAGSRLEQSVGATSAVFGESSKAIDSWAKGAAQSMGLSEAASREALALMGAQLKNFGYSVEESRDKAKELVQLGADLAATFGGTTTDAVTALTAALRGENDPIEKYGVSLNDARLKAEALSLGLYSGKGNLDANARATAALSLITKQTSAAQGQFGRELETVAGQAAVAKANFENAAAAIGQKLGPAWAAFLNVAAKGATILSGTDYGNMSEPVKKFAATARVGQQSTSNLIKAFRELTREAGDSRSSWDKTGRVIKGVWTSFWEDADAARANESLDNMRRAFGQLANESPEMAAQTVRALREMLTAAQAGDEELAALAESWGLTTEVINEFAATLPAGRGQVVEFGDANKEAAQKTWLLQDAAAEAARASAALRDRVDEARSKLQLLQDQISDDRALLDLKTQLRDNATKIGELRGQFEKGEISAEDYFTGVASASLDSKGAVADYFAELETVDGDIATNIVVNLDPSSPETIFTTLDTALGKKRLHMGVDTFYTSPDLKKLMEGGIVSAPGKIKVKVQGDVGYERMASGGIAKGGLTLVGEEGPEFVNMPKGARVHPAAETARMMAGATLGQSSPSSSAPPMVVNITTGADPREVIEVIKRYTRSGGQL